jgi:hypothetical protein
VAARALPAVGRARRKTGVALAANLLVAVVLGREHFEGGLDNATAKTGWRGKSEKESMMMMKKGRTGGPSGE